MLGIKLTEIKESKKTRISGILKKKMFNNFCYLCLMKRFVLLIFIFSFSLCEGQSWVWGRDCSAGYDPISCNIAGDTKGNGFLFGSFDSVVSFGTYKLTGPPTRRNDYLVKYDTLGSILWIKQIYGNPGYIIGNTDYSDNMYISGGYIDSVRFDSLTFASMASPAYLVKYSPSGKLNWGIQFTGNYIAASSIAFDDSSNVFLSGFTKGSMQFGTLNYTGPTTNEFFIVKYNSAGVPQWARYPTSIASSNSNSSSIFCDRQGNAYVTGVFHDSIIVGSTTLKSKGSSDIFLVKFDGNGNVLWAKQSFAQTRFDAILSNGMITDDANNIYLAGQIEGVVTIGSTNLNIPGFPPSVYLAKFDENGNSLWVKVSQPSLANAYSLTRDICDNIYMAVGESDSSEFIISTDTVITNPGNGLYIAFDTSGHVISSANLYSVGDDYDCIASNPRGNSVFAGGDILSTIVVGSDTLTPVGELPFIARWNNPGCKDVSNISSVSSLHQSIMLFPNPNTGKFTIQLSGVSGNPDGYQESVEIYNVLGEKVTIATLKQVQGDFKIDLTNQPNGIYLYRVISEEGNLVGEGKFVITH